jgi:ubiquinone/menaquinone biosynthesis C-methylase UbiE
MGGAMSVLMAGLDRARSWMVSHLMPDNPGAGFAEATMADSEDATKFTRVDETRDTSFFVKFLDARTGIEGERQVKELAIVMLAVDPGACVLDVGCGTGDDAREIAGLVGPNGKVVGLDSSVAMVEESRKRASSNSLPVEFVQGDAYKLQFPDRSFDRIRAGRVFVHLQDPERALDEMVRVLKPGGRVAVSDVDMGTCDIDSRHHETTRKVLNSFTDSLGSGWVGRSLPRMSRQAGCSMSSAHRVCFGATRCFSTSCSMATSPMLDPLQLASSPSGGKT